MKTIRNILQLFTLALLTLGVGYAQKQKEGAAIEATERIYNFGTIKEVDGPVSHVFTIKNVGTSPLVIMRVTASCGCTKPEFSTEPVAAGGQTAIKVTYNPAGRPGPFVKTIAIYSNGKDGAYTLQVKGKVE